LTLERLEGPILITCHLLAHSYIAHTFFGNHQTRQSALGSIASGSIDLGQKIAEACQRSMFQTQ
jgi:hypothetical protein